MAETGRKTGSIFQTFDRTVVQQGIGFEIRKRTGALFIIAGGGLGAAALMAAIGRRLQSTDSLAGAGSFCVGGAALIVTLSVAVLVASFVMLLFPQARLQCRLDPEQRRIISRRRQVAFEAIESFRIAPFQHSWISLVAAVRGGPPLMLLTTGEAHRRGLEALAERFNVLLHEREGVFVESASEPPELRAEVSRLFAVIAITVGILWTGVGYFVFDGLYFSSRRQPAIRIPVWWVGLLFIAVGVYRWIRDKR